MLFELLRREMKLTFEVFGNQSSENRETMANDNKKIVRCGKGTKIQEHTLNAAVSSKVATSSC